MIDRAFRIVRWRIWYLSGVQGSFTTRADWEYYLFKKKMWKSGKK